MARPGLEIIKTDGNLGRQEPSEDNVTGMVLNAVATAEMDLGTIYPINSLADAEALLLNDAYDDDNDVLVYHRIKRLFVRQPSIKLYILPVAQDVTLTQMADKENEYLAKLLRNQEGEIRQAIIARNPDGDYVPTIEDGLNDEVVASVFKAQELTEAEFEKGRYVDIFVEGRNFTGTTAAVKDLRDLVTECPDVSVVLMADNDISKKKAAYLKYAAVEDYVGIVSKAAVSQNPGELIENFNLTNVAAGAFLNPGLSSGNHINTYTDSDLEVLNEKGYVFATNQGVAGYHIEDSNTCAKITSDYAQLENSRSIKKAIRLARKALLPKVKGRLYVDPDTGQLAAEDRKELEAVTVESINPMVADQDVSGGVEAYIDPAQNILATSEFEVQFSFIPVAIGRKITLKIGFKNPLKK